jgi:hypothetical protein
MSWSVIYIGTPSNIVAALKKESERLTSTSKEEFDTALPGLITLVEMNHNSQAEPCLKLSANGHGYSSNELKYGNTNVTLENLGVALV